MEQILGALKSEKISGSVFVMVIALAWWAHGWAEERYVKQGDFDQLKTIMTDFVEDTQIVNASQLIRDKKLALQIAQAVNQSKAQTDTLSGEITKAEAYRACLIGEQPNCKHLKPPE